MTIKDDIFEAALTGESPNFKALRLIDDYQPHSINSPDYWWDDCLVGFHGPQLRTKARVFLLIVAESLE